MKQLQDWLSGNNFEYRSLHNLYRDLQGTWHSILVFYDEEGERTEFEGVAMTMEESIIDAIEKSV